MKVAIIDYGSGNLRSAQKAFERAAHDTGIAARIDLVRDADDVRRADAIVLPGVGAFRDCRDGLLAIDGMGEALAEAAIAGGRPFLGICVGMQLMATRGLEHGETPGLGWIAGDVELICPSDPALPVPHMGWNTLQAITDHPLLAGVETGESGQHAYFVHSYHLAVNQPGDLIAVSDYGGAITAMVARANLAGVQFHPEKSQALGLRLIANFLAWRP
jgi:imidazole glycerol-phosphate synthase subunit HisH